MKLRTIGMSAVAALALVAGRAQAQDTAAPAAAPADGGGWDTKYGILFTIPNLLQNGSSKVIDEYAAKVGFQYDLGAQTALRLSADLSWANNGIIETKNALGQTQKTLPNPTSAFGANLMAQYMMRMTTAAFSPYAGVGAGLAFTQSAVNGKEQTYAGVVTKIDDYTRSWGLGLNGTLGAEWRLHKAFAIFAEYEADLTLISSSHSKYKTNGALVSESSQTDWLSLNMGIGQGGKLGLIAFF